MIKGNMKNILILIISIFAVWNLSWYLITTIKYHKFVEVIPKYKGVYIKKEDDYLYNVKKPAYLHFTGNLGVAKSESMDGLIIWPLLFGGYKYGIRLQTDDGVYEIYVDEKINLINKDDAVAAQQIEKYKSEVEELFSNANKMWHLK